MLTMSNQFEMYHRQQQQHQQQRRSLSASSLLCSSESIPIGGPGTTTAGGCSGGGGGGSGGDSPSGAGKESIHSGQFMVSHFEAEEAQDDDDSEIKMLDPEDPSLLKPDEPNACTEVQLYVPLKVKEYGSMSMITSHLEIETSLTKLFKCMNLAYSQKLTSPKWNHFKGVRLRWKDKIRLNNVIWRCWHMQFILKRRTPVCQFASPLDVDIHSNPQSVVLEGKYWKRQLTVIKAEYRKWRRNFKTNKTGCLIYDTKSEFDLFEWSPLANDRGLMLTDDWTTDTLFSAINVPFPFPDPREIARGAGNADFIQPSLGPLQPNLDDIDITFEELLQSSRLAPVPEEGSDDMLKSVDYGFSAIMGPDQMDSSNIMDVTNQNQSITNGDDTNMMELNTPLNAMQFSELERQFRENAANTSLLGSQTDLSTSMMMSGNQSSDSDFNSSPKRPSIKTFPISMDTSSSQMSGFSGKSVIKGRVSKTSQRPFRREPHNYDKAQPTSHQTEIYQQMLAERQQQHMQQSLALQLQAQSTSNQSHQPNMQFPTAMLNNSNNNNNNNYSMPQPQNMLNIPTNSNLKAYAVASKSNLLPNVKIESTTSSGNNVLSMFNMNTASQGDSGFHHQSPGMGNLSQVNPSNSSTSSPSFKPYPNVQTFQKSASTGNYINVRAAITAGVASQINALLQDHAHLQHSQHQQHQHHQQQQQQQQQQQHHHHQQQHSQSLPTPLHQHQLILPSSSATNSSSSSSSSQQQQQQILPKEMFRSNSLPLNSSLQKLEARIEHFAVPKYQAKSNKSSRSRSNSQNAPIHSSGMSGGSTLQIPQLQSATSDPILNSTLAQLLTAPSLPPPTTANTNSNYVPSGSVNASQQQHAASHQSMQSISKPVSPKKSNSLPVPAPALMMHSPPGNKMLSFPPPSGGHLPASLSPDSFHDQDSPLSPTHNMKYPRETQRRAGHIHAEQKRRYNIKNGFDMLHSLIPQLQQNPNAKLSKAAMLQKGADYIKQLRSERNILKEKMELLRKERDNLNSSLSHLHSILPANGAPVTRQRTEHVRQLYEHYVRCRTMQNWKFWILGLILEPLLASYTTSVSSASTDELRRTVFLWVDQHCSLVDLRPAVSNKLRYLSTTTDILSDPPSTLQEEVAKAINNTPGQHPNLNGS